MINDQKGLVKIIRILILVTVVLVLIGVLVLGYQVYKVRNSVAEPTTEEPVIAE